MVQHWFLFLFADKAGVQKDLVLGYDNDWIWRGTCTSWGRLSDETWNVSRYSRFTINGKDRIDENENHNNLTVEKNGFNTVIIWEVRGTHGQ